MASWGIILSMNLLIWRRPQWDAARVIKVKVSAENSVDARKLNGTTVQNGSLRVKVNGANGVNGVRQRRPESDLTMQDLGNGHAAPEKEYQHIWQPFPSQASFLERLGWAMDLSSSFRGAGTWPPRS